MNKLTITDGLDEMILTYQGMTYILELKESDLDDHWFTRKNPKGVEFDINIWCVTDTSKDGWITHKSDIFCRVYQIKIDDDGWCVIDTSKWESIKIVRKEVLTHA